MIKIKEIGFTVYAVTDMAKARDFYENKIGLSPSADFDGSKNPSWVEYNIGPGTFAIGSSPDWKPSSDGATVAFEVDDFDQAVADLKEKKVTFLMEAADWPTCHMAVVNDPDGNKVLIHKRK
jgi:catechol 2,3-dioxygenase-like lactoylglutathione lyase family enzyme